MSDDPKRVDFETGPKNGVIPVYPKPTITEEFREWYKVSYQPGSMIQSYLEGGTRIDYRMRQEERQRSSVIHQVPALDSSKDIVRSGPLTPMMIKEGKKPTKLNEESSILRNILTKPLRKSDTNLMQSMQNGQVQGPLSGTSGGLITPYFFPVFFPYTPPSVMVPIIAFPENICGTCELGCRTIYDLHLHYILSHISLVEKTYLVHRRCTCPACIYRDARNGIPTIFQCTTSHFSVPQYDRMKRSLSAQVQPLDLSMKKGRFTV